MSQRIPVPQYYHKYPVDVQLEVAQEASRLWDDTGNYLDELTYYARFDLPPSVVRQIVSYTVGWARYVGGYFILPELTRERVDQALLTWAQDPSYWIFPLLLVKGDQVPLSRLLFILGGRNYGVELFQPGPWSLRPMLDKILPPTLLEVFILDLEMQGRVWFYLPSFKAYVKTILGTGEKQIWTRIMRAQNFLKRRTKYSCCSVIG